MISVGARRGAASLAAPVTFRATIRRAFELTGRGTVIAVEIVEGAVTPGDKLVVPTADGYTCVVEVREVGFLDFDIGRDTFRAEVALSLGEAPASAIAIGGELRAADA